MGVLLAHMTVDFGGFSVPSENGLRVAMGVAGGAALAAFGLAVLIPGRRGAGVGSGTAVPAPASAESVAAR